MSQIRERYPPQGLPRGTEILSGTFAARPAPGVTNRYYWATDEFTLFRDNGVIWEIVSGPYYRRTIYPIHSSPESLYNNRGTFSPLANVYYCSYFEIPFRCTILRIGLTSTNIVSGNFRLGVHGPDVNGLPNSRICEVGSTGVGALGLNDWRWFTPTTTPIIQPNIYYVGVICDEPYVPATTGFQTHLGGPLQAAVDTNMLDGMAVSYNQNVGAFAVPDPMTEVLWGQRPLLIALRVQT